MRDTIEEHKIHQYGSLSRAHLGVCANDPRVAPGGGGNRRANEEERQQDLGHVQNLTATSYFYPNTCRIKR